MIFESACAWCKKFAKLTSGEWVKVTRKQYKTICSHGICPDCEKDFWNK